MHIATFKYKIHITLPTAHIPYHTTHPTLHFDHHSACLIGRQTIPHHSVLLPQPHFTSCISTPCRHIPHAPHHSTSHHNISHLTLHDITASHHWCCTYSTLHLTSPHHSHRVNKVQHPTSGIAKRWHITPNLTSRRVIWWYWNTWNVVWCGMMCCAGNVVWCEILSCGGEIWMSVQHIVIAASRTSSHHSTTFYIASSDHLHVTRPHSTSHHHSSPYRPFHITPAPLTIPPCNTIFKIAPLISATLRIMPHLVLHPILHCVPVNTTFHVLHTTFLITPYIGHMHRTTTSVLHHSTF